MTQILKSIRQLIILMVCKAAAYRAAADLIHLLDAQADSIGVRGLTTFDKKIVIGSLLS